MKHTIRLSETEAAEVIADHLRAKGYTVERPAKFAVNPVKFVCTEHYPSAKDFEGNCVQHVLVEVEAPQPGAGPAPVPLSRSQVEAELRGLLPPSSERLAGYDAPIVKEMSDFYHQQICAAAARFGITLVA